MADYIFGPDMGTDETGMARPVRESTVAGSMALVSVPALWLARINLAGALHYMRVRAALGI